MILGSGHVWLSYFPISSVFGLKFSETLTFYPSLENSDDYTWRSEASLSAPLTDRWAVNFKNIINYDNNPDSPDIDKTDYTWILGLNFPF